jgi:hypothetical protein
MLSVSQRKRIARKTYHARHDYQPRRWRVEQQGRGHAAIALLCAGCLLTAAVWVLKPCLPEYELQATAAAVPMALLSIAGACALLVRALWRWVQDAEAEDRHRERETEPSYRHYPDAYRRAGVGDDGGRAA